MWRASSLRSVNQPNVWRCRREGLDHRLRRDVFLHHAEQRRFVELLLVIGLHRLRRQDPRTDQRDRKHQQRHRGELPVQEQHQDDARDQFQQRQAALLAKLLTAPSKADRSTEKRDRISPRLVRAK